MSSARMARVVSRLYHAEGEVAKNSFAGTVRKALGISFVGESRENVTVLLDAQLEGIPEGSVS